MPETKKISADVFEITLPKRFTFDDSHRFNQILTKLPNNDCNVVTINMAETQFMDSAGLGMLLLARDEAGKMNKSLTLKSPQAYIKKLFHVSRFNELFTIEE